MAKAYWVVCYRSISDPTARENYSKLGAPAVLAAGGRFLTRGIPAKTYEHGIKERTVVIEFDSLAQAIAAHDSPAYQAALTALGNGAERDLRIVEGIDGRALSDDDGHARQPSCSARTRPGGLQRISPSCRSCWSKKMRRNHRRRGQILAWATHASSAGCAFGNALKTARQCGHRKKSTLPFLCLLVTSM
jgi:uncharacterized protein (DUF1330 family)